MKVLIIILGILALTSCVDIVTFVQAMEITPAGFWYGVWHGMILPFAWIGSLFVDDVAIYAIYNNGGWYDFGFFIGIAGLVGANS